jgi:exosortase/archaeosortase family protein
MKKFLFLYWSTTALLFTLFYWELSPIATTINTIQTNFITTLVSITLPIDMTDGYTIIINSHYRLVIEKACNGLIPYLFFLSSIIAFPSAIVYKIKWALLGYIIITTINSFRIWLVAQLVLKELDNFSLAHDFIGNSLLIFTVILLFILFLKYKN